MKLAVQVIVALLALIITFSLVSAALGHLMAAVVIVVIALAVAGGIRVWLGGREQSQNPDIASVRRAEKEAEKRLRQMERDVNTNRTER